MSLLSGVKNFKNKLVRIGTKEPLNFFSIVLILGLDFFVLVNLFQGLDLQTRQLESPREIIPYECTNLIQDIETNNDKERTVFNALDRNNNYYFNIENKYSADFINERNKDKIDLKCREIFDAAISLANNEELKWQHEEIERLEVTKHDYESEISQYENNYDTMLLEEIANQPPQDSIIDGKADDVKMIIRGLNNEISTINLRVSNIKENLMQSEEVKTFLGIISKNKAEILEKDKKLRFWYPIKKTGIQFLFLLPVLLLFLFLYRRSLRKNSELLILVFAHLLVVVSIPIILEILRLAFEILPFHILEDLLELLEALNLIVIWNYLLILLGIGITIGLIYFIQKKLFSKERLYLKRIAQKKCFSCGVKIDSKQEHCYNCGEQQTINCPNCNKVTYKTGTHCVNCGVNIKEATKTQSD